MTTLNAAQLLLDATSPRIVAIPLPSNLTADWATQVTGTGKPANNADVTAANTAAGIAGQGSFATVNAVTPANISYLFNTGVITSAEIADAAISSAKIGSLAVTSAKIADAAITTAKIGDAAITTAKIGDANITSAKIADAAITTAKIGDANITTAKIADAAITDAKIGNLSANKINAGTLSANFLSGGVMTGSSITIPSSAGGNLVDIGYNATVIGYRRLAGYNISAGNLSDPTLSAVEGASGSSAAGVYGSSSGAGGHGVRGEAGSGLGFVGYNGGTYDFYASGSATNYGPFTGAHDALVVKGSALEVGDIVCDVQVVVRKNVSNTICEVALSTAPAQAAAVGVVCTLARSLDVVHTAPAAMLDRFWSFPPGAEPIESVLPVDEWYAVYLTHDAITINAVGEGMVAVCGEGGDLLPGDLIVSSSQPGKGMKQPDNVVRSVTVAKCREAVTFDFAEQVRLVACIYLCG